MKARKQAKTRHGHRLLYIISAATLVSAVVLVASQKLPYHPFTIPEPQKPTGLTVPSDFTLQDKIGQLLMVGVTSKKMAIDLEKRYQIGGFLLRPDSGLYSRSATAAIRSSGSLPPLLAVDEEGGQIARLDSKAFADDSARHMGTLPDAEVTRLGAAMGRAITGIGADVDFAPVADLDNGQNAAISLLDRSFSSDSDVVGAKAAAFAIGLRQADVVPTFKHFPGLGNASGPTDGNTDTGSATTPSYVELQQHDLLPYSMLLGGDQIACVMVGNQIVPGLTNSQPASLSHNTYRLLRGTYHFNQVVFTDELVNAKAISNVTPSPSEAVIGAIQAGADMPLINPDGEQAVGTIIQAVTQAAQKGEISQQQIDASLVRILQLKTALTK